eukprot:CAMPEP_0167781166 /NCGR_PEP_ID=MMETSP0111_2-20121227/5778_1 /TAXON_ID=91324 /ORGANISM="Lotharella globosa, Strain CCCM811" /LENGTH=567 /DNA_ID=CAMNT_0007671791 /DNA_START=196 /DNA_END=1899 /DNA_ORIENTATION=-
MIQAFNFNQDEATRCFKRGINYDKNCLMLHWGVAWINGPNYNSDGLFHNPEIAMEYLGKVRKMVSNFEEKKTSAERDSSTVNVPLLLANAMTQRYSVNPDPNEQAPIHNLDEYSHAMKNVAEKVPDDPDVQCLYIESLMNHAPWELWQKTSPEAKERVRTLIKLLDKAVKDHPKHVGLHHMNIHFYELSPTPTKAMVSVDALGKLGKDAGHLVHMPSHIQVQLGDYESSIKANQDAALADEKFVTLTGQNKGVYRLYRLHNLHFLAWCGMFDGQYKASIEASEKIEKWFKNDTTEGEMFWGFLEPFLSVRLHVYVRFGKWDEIHSFKPPKPKKVKDSYCSLNATMHYARGVAFAAVGKVSEAKEEQKKLRSLMQLEFLIENFALFKNKMVVTQDEMDNGALPGTLNVAEAVLDGEIAYREAVLSEGKHPNTFDKAFELLRKAVWLDDHLHYDEPWGWMMPARHALGALLLEQKRYPEAILALREDLGEVVPSTWDESKEGVFYNKHPKNLWALRGLSKCYRATGKEDEAKVIEASLKEAGARCDVASSGSPPTCYCATKSMKEAKSG